MRFFVKRLLPVFIAVLLMGCGKTQPISKTFFALDTFCTITVYDSADESILSDGEKLVKSCEKMLSATVSGSDVERINHAGGKSVRVSGETARVIEKALEYSRLTDGAFDITIYPVLSLWDFRSGDTKVPEDAALKEALRHVDYKNVFVSGNTVTLADPGAGIELGGIAKGYICDVLSDFLRERGVRSAIINLGGNVAAIGKRPDGEAFRVGVKKPFGDGNETVTVLPCSDESVVSSGIDERYFIADGVLYHHILDPATGYPAVSELNAVSVMAERSVDADALSTCLFLLGKDEGEELLKKCASDKPLRAVFIGKDNEVLSDVNAP
ncbi:MAG: FAD:protein FMN transferase [Lachnospiraceae bacterium]|nr:FAD:protein FMN transferase [Lachnospiraceae bacterium]